MKFLKGYSQYLESFDQTTKPKKRSYDTFDNVKKYVKDIYDNEYSLIGGEFINSNSKLEVKHNKCGFIWNPTIKSFIIIKRGCPMCFGTKKQNIDSIINRCNNLHGDDYKIIDTSGYVNNKSKIIIKHKCGFEFSASCSNFLNNKTTCAKCSGKKKLTKEDIIERFEKIYGVDYKLSIGNDIKNGKSKLIIFHNNCGNKWEASISNILYQNTGCPFCKMSKGEKLIKKYLDNNNIKYQQEFRFLKCKDKRPLPFDFYLPYLKTCIEYDGIQHSKSILFFGGINTLERNKKIDEIKNRFCIENDISLIRIDYMDISRINEILDKSLERFEESLQVDLYDTNFNFRESLNIYHDVLLQSINAKEVDIFNEFSLPKDEFANRIDIDYLSKNITFINSLSSIGLKISTISDTSEYETFINKPCKFMLIYDTNSNELENPEFMLFQVYNSTLQKWEESKLYKIKDDIKKFFDKLTSRTIEITDGDENYIYTTSNGNDWELQNLNKENDIYKRFFRKEDLQKLLDDRKVKLTIV